MLYKGAPDTIMFYKLDNHSPVGILECRLPSTEFSNTDQSSKSMAKLHSNRDLLILHLMHE
jgi:hypothetical protein